MELAMSELTSMTSMTSMTSITSMTSMTSMGFVGSPTALGALSGFSGDPLLTDALIRSRPRTLPASCEMRDAPYPEVGANVPLEWWQPDVRGHIASGELSSGLLFKPDGHTASLFHFDLEDANAPRKLVASIQRPDCETFKAQAQKVIDFAYADGRRSRAPEIITQILPQVPFWSSIVPLYPARHRRTFEFLGIALHFAMQTCHRFKHALAVPRPNELTLCVQPVLQTPGWSAFPSGHATEAFVAARLLRAFTGQAPASGMDQALQQQAKQIADNRVYAGLHYPIDSGAGQMLGETLAEYVIARSTASKKWRSRSFLVPTPRSLDDYDFDPLQETMDKDTDWLKLGNPVRAAPESTVLEHLWDAACKEWEAAGYQPER
jgi:hypothetical protein